jgi:DNA-binding IclR family transcriptional regulator
MSGEGSRPSAASRTKASASAGSQTLMRGLDLLEAVTRESMSLPDLSRVLDLNRSTAHRLASALVERGYLRFVPRQGYMLGAKLLELGYAAHQQIDLPRLARPHLEALSDLTEDTVHLGVMEEDKALYLDKIPGRRRVEISSRIGERQPLSSTGLGKALILDWSPEKLKEVYDTETDSSRPDSEFQSWSDAMKRYVANGHSFDLEENEHRIRCVGAPVRDETGAIVAAISVSSVAQYMDNDRMQSLVKDVRAAAEAISRDIGWSESSGRKGR